MIEVPAVVRNKALVAGQSAWLDCLPSLIAELENDWGIAVGPTFAGGTEALVAEATTQDANAAVLKVMVPRPGDAARHEITVLELARGKGCPRLLRADVDRGALLMERLCPSMADLGLPMRQRQELLCDAAQRLWRPAPDVDLPTGADKGRCLIDFISETWDRLDRPCRERVVDHALACAERRIAAHDDERAVLVHGDVHQWNAVRATDGFALIDPDGLIAEPEYDLGVLMREDPDDLLHGDPRRRSRWLADRTGLDEVAIWEWGVVERVSTGLLCTEIGVEPEAGQMLAVAERVAGLS